MSDNIERSADANTSEGTSNPIAMENTNRNDSSSKDEKQGNFLIAKYKQGPIRIKYDLSANSLFQAD